MHYMAHRIQQDIPARMPKPSAVLRALRRLAAKREDLDRQLVRISDDINSLYRAMNTDNFRYIMEREQDNATRVLEDLSDINNMKIIRDVADDIR